MVKLMKGACVKCGGRIGFPPESAGKQIACPHCQTATPLIPAEEIGGGYFYKCACFHCGGKLQYPIEIIRQAVACSHCGGATMLVAPAHSVPAGPAPAPPVPRAVTPTPAVAKPVAATGALPPLRLAQAAVPKRRFSKKMILALVLTLAGLGLIAALVRWLPKLRKPTSSGAPLELLEHKLTNPSGGVVFIEGTVTNRSTAQMFNVQIEFALFDDANKQIGTTKDTANKIEPGAAWSFKALVLEKEAKRAELLKLAVEEK